MTLPATLRTFLAIELPSDMKKKILNIQKELYSRSPVNVMEWPPPESFHLTLFYLGETDVKLRDAIEEALEDAVINCPPFSLLVKGFGVFNSVSVPRVFWVGVHDFTKQLQMLYDSVKNKLGPLGYKSDHHKYHPHLTVCKAIRGTTHEQLEPFKKIAEETYVPELGEVFVNEVIYLHSVPNIGTTKYITLKNISLIGK